MNILSLICFTRLHRDYLLLLAIVSLFYMYRKKTYNETLGVWNLMFCSTTHVITSCFVALKLRYFSIPFRNDVFQLGKVF